MDEQNPYSAPLVTSEAPAKTVSSRTKTFCIWFYALAVAGGVQDVFAPNVRFFELAINLALTLCVITWVFADAAERQQPILGAKRVWYFLFSAILVPFYMIKTQGWRGLGWSVLHFLGLVFTMLVVEGILGTLMYGADWWE